MCTREELKKNKMKKKRKREGSSDLEPGELVVLPQ